MFYRNISGRIREKKAERDEKQEEKTVMNIQKQIDDLFNYFKHGYEKKLRKMGLSFSHLGLSGADAKERNAGAVIARFTDKEGYPITLVQTQGVYGDFTSKPIVYIGATFWGTIVQGSIPFTLLFKEVEKGFMQKAKVFLPLTSLPFNERDLLLDPRLQEPVVTALNADKRLVDSIAGKLHLSTPIQMRPLITISYTGLGGKCVIVPSGYETIFLRNYGAGSMLYPETFLEILSRIRKHILAHPHAEKVLGSVPDPIFNTMYALCKAKSL